MYTNTRESMFPTWSKHVFDSYNEGEFKVSENAATASYIHPGLSYRHFDREGNPDIREVMIFFNEIRNLTLSTFKGPDGTNHLDFLQLYQDRFLFVTSTEFDIKREFYDKKLPKWPLRVTNSLEYVGNSSFTIKVKISTHESDVPLATQRSSYVLVDRQTRKSKPFPDWYKLKYGDLVQDGKPFRVETLNKPTETFHLETMVLWSDTDRNNHSNYSTYLYYTINCLRAALRLWAQQQNKSNNDQIMPQLQAATVAVKSSCNSNNTVKGLRGISSEIVRSGLKSVRVCYNLESVEGDILNVHLWQEEGDDVRVKAVIERGGDTLCHLHLEYFGVASSSNL